MSDRERDLFTLVPEAPRPQDQPPPPPRITPSGLGFDPRPRRRQPRMRDQGRARPGTFGWQLRQERLKRRMTQGEVARLVGVTSRTVSRWEANETMMSGQTAAQLVRDGWHLYRPRWKRTGAWPAIDELIRLATRD